MASTFKNAIAKDVGVAAVDIYTATASTTVIGLALANTSAAGILVSVTITKSAVLVYIVKNAPVPVGGTLVLFGGDQKLVLGNTDKLSVTSSAATSIDAVLSMLELS